VGIGHDGDVMKGARQVGQVFRLGERILVQLVEPEQDGKVLGGQDGFYNAPLLNCTGGL
jgi:hypothetical protein